MKLKILVPIFAIFILCAASAQAWCVAGIGNTCGDASRETSFLGKYFNLNTPTPTDSFDVFGIGGAIKKAVSSSSAAKTPSQKPNSPALSPVTSVNDVIINSDLYGSEVATAFTSISPVKVGTQDAWFYDLDVLGIQGATCIGCPDERNLPGFDYDVLVQLRNTGNVANPNGFTIELIAEDDNGKVYYNSVSHRPGFPTGTGYIPLKIYNVGLKEGTVKATLIPEVIQSGLSSSDKYGLKITVRIKNDDKETQPGFVQYVDTKRVCTDKKDPATNLTLTTCKNVQTVVTKVIKAEYSDPASDDEKTSYLYIDKVSANVIADGGFLLK